MQKYFFKLEKQGKTYTLATQLFYNSPIAAWMDRPRHCCESNVYADTTHALMNHVTSEYRVKKQLRFWNARPRFAYSQYNFYRAQTSIKGRLLSSPRPTQPFILSGSINE